MANTAQGIQHPEHLIGGEWVSGAGAEFTSCNPARPSEIVASFHGGTRDDLASAVSVALSAQGDWETKGSIARGVILRKVADLITTLQEDFILMARAKGVSKRRVLFRHALRPSMFSVITVFGINAGALVGGALVVETFFGIPGIGTAVVEAILREDFPVVLAIVMIVATGFVVLNFLVDLLYSVLDPRVRS